MGNQDLSIRMIIRKCRLSNRTRFRYTKDTLTVFNPFPSMWRIFEGRALICILVNNPKDTNNSYLSVNDVSSTSKLPVGPKINRSQYKPELKKLVRGKIDCGCMPLNVEIALGFGLKS